jgi:hypothetical protein
MLPVFAVMAGKTFFDIAAGIFIAGGAISSVKMAHDKGIEKGYHRGMEYRVQEIVHLRRLLNEFQMTREALKDRLHALAVPFARIDICDPRFFSKTLKVLERHLPGWRTQIRQAV